MFDIGFAELLVLAVISMVVIGPERLPGVARTVGKVVGQARRMMTGLQNQIEQEIKLDELNKKIMSESKDVGLDNLNTIHPPRAAETDQQLASEESAVDTPPADSDSTQVEKNK